MEIAERIKYLRKQILKMSRETFANTLGTSSSVIYNIENNRLKNPTHKNPIFKLICEKFKVNEDWLLDGVGGDDNIFLTLNKKDELMLLASKMLQNEDSDFVNRLVSALSRLDDNQVELLTTMAETMIEQKEKD